MIKTNKQHVLYAVFSCILTGTIFWYLLSKVSLADIFTLLKGISVEGIASFILLSLSMSFFRCWRYMIILQVNGYRPGKLGLYLVTLARNFCSDLLPARLGTLVYIYLLQSRLGVSFAASASSFAVSFVFDVIAFAILVILAVTTVKTVLISQSILIFASSVLLTCSIICLVMLPRIIHLFCFLLSHFLPHVKGPWLRRGIQHLESTTKDLLRIRQQGIYARVFVLSLATRGCKYLSLYILFLALVIPLGLDLESFPFSKIFLGLGSAELAASLPISGLAGFGLYEGAWSFVFQLVGYSSELAISTGISHHLFTQIYGYSLGAIALLLLLLPIFKSQMETPTKKRKVQGIGFWFWFIVSGGCIFTLIQLSFVILKSNSLTITNQRQSQSISSTVLTTGDLTLPDNVSGTVVYQRLDGIFQMDIKTKNEVFLVQGGSYPRWSANGKLITYLHNNKIMVMSANGTNKKTLARAQKPGAVCFHPDMQHVLYTDGQSILSVSLADLSVEVVVTDDEFREIDISKDGTKIVATVKTFTGYFVKLFDLSSKEQKIISRGCSASFSPDDRLITVNAGNHLILNMHDPDTARIMQKLTAPQGDRFDNQFFSNNSDWLVSTSEEQGNDIFLHQLSTNNVYRLTKTGDCDRADVYLQLGQ